MKKLFWFLFFGGMICFQSLTLFGQNAVSEKDMQKIYEEIKTPYKYGLVLVPGDNSRKADCPTIFRKDGSWYMTYIIFDGRGYETWLATSEDLLEWKTLGKVLSFTNEKRWDRNQAAGYLALIDTDWGGDYHLNTYRHNYWMSYFGGRSDGYEQGILSIGMAYTEENPATPHEWNRLDEPVLRPTDADAGYRENTTLYKSFVVRDPAKTTGSEFVMFYNASGDSVTTKGWTERIGLATSDDMVHWKRYADNPVLGHHRGITGDAYLQQIGKIWVMFYYGAFWPEGRNDAFDRFACSYDLLHWTDWTGDDLIKPSEPYDHRFAHKPCVVKWNGVVYHFYTAVNTDDQRGIALATSRDLGKSDLRFAKIE